MKKELKYLFFLFAAALVYVTFKLLSPREYDWSITLHQHDKNPFGAYAFAQLLPGLFKNEPVSISAYTLYELYDTTSRPMNFISLSTEYNAAEEDVISLLRNVSQGGQAFLSSQYFVGTLSDSLGFDTNDYYFHTEYSTYLSEDDTARLKIVNPATAATGIYQYPRNSIRHYFNRFDSVRTTVLSVNDLGLPVTIRIQWGQGSIVLNSTPMVFTNAYLLHENNPEFASLTLSNLSPRPVQWTEFYHLGRIEPATPLRFILSSPPLKWAYYLTVAGLLIFMVFEARRKQRVIPVIRPLANTSLEFVSTMGNLYFQTGNHKDIADKMINYFLEHIRSTYWLNTQTLTSDFFYVLHKRSGKPDAEIRKLFTTIAQIQNAENISAADLQQLNQSIQDFSKTKNIQHTPHGRKRL